LPNASATRSTASRSFWSGTISFGLVSIPVDLFAANRTSTLGMRMLGPNGEPMQRRYICTQDGKTVDTANVVRGFEVKKGEFVTVTDEELQSLEPDKTRDIDLNRFVPRESVSPAYFERGHFLVPSGPTSKAYRLLADTMERTGKVGIGTFVMRDKAYVIAIFAERGILHGQTLRYADELRSAKDVGLIPNRKVDSKVVAQMKKVIAKSSTSKFAPAEMQDDRAAAVRSMAQAKFKKHQDVVQIDAQSEAEEDDDNESSESPLSPTGKVIDLMEVLRQRLGASEAGKQKKPKLAGASPKKSATKKTVRKSVKKRS